MKVGVIRINIRSKSKDGFHAVCFATCKEAVNAY